MPVRTPQIEIVSQREDALRFVLSDTDVSVANALRRVMIAEVPTLAIDVVFFHDNTTVLSDEFLAHRLGLLPIRVNPSTANGNQGVGFFTDRNFCDCGGSFCPKCAAIFYLDARNDGQTEVLSVYTNDIKCSNPDVEIAGYSSKEELTMASDLEKGEGIVIAKLGRGQALKFMAFATKGIGKIHAKWSPVAIASYTFEPRVVLNDARLDEINDAQKTEFVESCPAKVYELRSKKVLLANEANCVFCNKCLEKGREFKRKGDDDNVVSIGTVPNRFIFTVETVGSLRPDEVVVAALKRLQALMRDIKNECHTNCLDRKEDPEKEVYGSTENIASILFKDTGGFI
jgi:DNA-directed RNA polymerase II subunit RPB3